MSHQSQDTEPMDPQRTTDDLDAAADGEDERWEIKPGMTVDDIIASRHLRPSEAIPDWFEQCDICAGVGCCLCDDRGWLHPQRAENAFQYVVDYVREDHLGQRSLPRWVQREIEQARAGKRRCSDIARIPPGKRLW